MSIVLVQEGSGTGAPSLVGVSQGNLLILALPYIIATGGASTPTIVDSSGQTWNADNVPTPQGVTNDWVGVALFSLPDANAGSHSITPSVAGSLAFGYGMAELSGMGMSSVLDQTGVGGGSTSGTQSMTVTSSGATTQISELVIAAMAIETNAVASAAITDPPSGFTSLGVNNTWQGSNFGFEIAFKVLSAIATPGASWSWTAAATSLYQSVLATYKAATGGVAQGVSGLGGGVSGDFISAGVGA
jgi:hypothetical protein